MDRSNSEMMSLTQLVPVIYKTRMGVRNDEFISRFEEKEQDEESILLVDFVRPECTFTLASRGILSLSWIFCENNFNCNSSFVSKIHKGFASSTKRKD
jgi:hypothetical protein